MRPGNEQPPLPNAARCVLTECAPAAAGSWALAAAALGGVPKANGLLFLDRLEIVGED